MQRALDRPKEASLSNGEASLRPKEASTWHRGSPFPNEGALDASHRASLWPFDTPSLAKHDSARPLRAPPSPTPAGRPQFGRASRRHDGAGAVRGCLSPAGTGAWAPRSTVGSPSRAKWPVSREMRLDDLEGLWPGSTASMTLATRRIFRAS